MYISEWVIWPVTGALGTLESFIESLRSKSQSIGRDTHFYAVLVEIYPVFPPEMFAFPVFQFGKNGEVVRPTGEPDNPFVFAINEKLRGGEQVTTFLHQILSTIYRQEVTSDVEAGITPLTEDLAVATKLVDDLAGRQTELLLRLARAESSVAPIIRHLATKDIRIIVRLDSDLRPSRDSFLNSMAFFRGVYNGNAAVRDVIDRVVYSAIGRGFRVSGGSDSIRRLVERRQSSLAMHHVLAQLTRDGILFGTSCMVFGEDLDIAVRLIRPDFIDFEHLGDQLMIIDRNTEDIWPVNGGSLLIHRGVNQRQSPFGVSILEPVVPIIANLTLMSQAINVLATVPQEFAQSDLARGGASILAADRLRTESEQALKRAFRFPDTQLFLDRDGLYFPGWDNWQL